VNVDVLIAGAGPAGLAAAIELRRLGAGHVLVVDREQAAGGVPRHSAHIGYGLRDLRRVMTGPDYARHYAEAAVRAGAEVRPGTTVAGWPEPRSATLVSADGIETVTAAAVLLATGCRERPRAARLVPGGRPHGVMTTGELQQRVYLGGQRLPGRALIVGAEHVSFSAMLTLAHAGAEVVALVTDQRRHQSYAAFALAAQARWRTAIWTSTAVHRVVGHHRLDGVELVDLRTGAIRFVGCDTLVFTGDWIPDHELARLAGTEIDPGTRGPTVDTGLETSVPHMFAAGNLVHAAETADVAAISGQHAARQITSALQGVQAPRTPRIPVAVTAPLSWISPNAIRIPGPPPPRGHFLLRSEVHRRLARLEVRQGDRVLATVRTRLAPGRPVHLDAGWLTRAEASAGPVGVFLA
jgi:thioredoxin reductase